MAEDKTTEMHETQGRMETMSATGDSIVAQPAETGQAEAGKAEARQAEARQAEAGQAEARQAEAGQAEARQESTPREEAQAPTDEQSRPQPRHRALKMVLMAAFACVIVAVSSILFVPNVDNLVGNARTTVRGMYNQPENSLDVLILGTSTMSTALSPLEMYEDEGVSAYNVSTLSQPLVASYYLLRDAYDRNPNSLTTVIIDPSYAISKLTESSYADSVITAMPFSLNKIEAIEECSKHFEGYDLVAHLIPVLQFHSRWNELSLRNYDTLLKGDDQLDTSERGYIARYGNNYNLLDKELIDLSASVTTEIDYDDERLEKLYTWGKEYLDRIVSFCEEHNLKLIFVKVPKAEWSNLSHDAMQKLANDYDVEYLDLSTPEHRSACKLSYNVDYIDSKHLNVTGMKKATKYVCDYLKTHGYLSEPQHVDAGMPTESELTKHKQIMADGDLIKCTDFYDYINLLKRKRYTVFIAAYRDIADGLDDKTRKALKELGLEELSAIKTNQSYIGILRSGEAKYEHAGDARTRIEYYGSFDGKKLQLGKESLPNGATFENSFYIQSCTITNYEEAQFKMDKFNASNTPEEITKNRFEDHYGLNIIVFNHQTGKVLDTAVFDTHDTLKRISDIPSDTQP